MAVHFFFADALVTLTQRTKLKKYITSIFQKEGRGIDSINYVFCSDVYLLGINQQFLNHDYYTDIITFDISGKGMPVVAEVYISIERVKENAAEFHQTIKHELHRVMFHGVLHLCGYKDKRKADKEIMRQKETFYINQYFNSVPRNTVSP